MKNPALNYLSDYELLNYSSNKEVFSINMTFFAKF